MWWLVLLNGGDMQGHFDFVSDDDTASFDRCVPVHTELTAIDLGCGSERRPIQAVGINDLAIVFGIQHNRFRYVANCQITMYFESVLIDHFNVGALERDVTELL